jgi:UDP-glucose 4-epimerase
VSAPLGSVLVTGAGGYLGRLLVDSLAGDPGGLHTVVAADVRLPPAAERLPGIEYAEADVRSSDLAGLITRFAVDVVVHLSAVVTPGRRRDRRREWEVDVRGTERVLEACLRAGVRKLVVTSSGAAYGYHADNPAELDEGHPLRGNPEFAYADHKRQVEEMLARARLDHPGLGQLVLRPGTILGATTRNPITDLFEGRVIVGLRGTRSPFVFAWDEDVVRVIRQGLREPGRGGVYNVAGDGVLTLPEIAALLGKPYVAVPVGLLRGALRVLRLLGLTAYGPEQVDFLRYRPVLSNRRLKQEFGYVPRKTTREAFEVFAAVRRGGG